jgi:cytochrome c-type biogenesis protein CcmE
MKRTQIVLIIVILVAIGVVITTLVSSSTYADFSTAKKNIGSDYQVIGVLNIHKPIVYDARKNANSFSFFMKDKDSTEMKVVYSGTKPQDFERCDQVVISGSATDSVFYAKTLLLKCPSKYNDKKVPVTYKKTQFKTI